MNNWALTWSHGHGFVESVGAMLGPVHFKLADGREVQPFFAYPWTEESLPPNEQPLTGLMVRGRGEWPCVPFGLCPDPEILGWEHSIHGRCSNEDWQRLDDGKDPAFIRLGFIPDDASPIESLVRDVRGVEGRAEVECRLTIKVRRACDLPIGLHPTLRMPRTVGALKLDPGKFQFGRTFPGEMVPGADCTAPGEYFDDLKTAPRRGGGTVDLTAFPLAERTENLVMMCGSEGRLGATNTEDNYTVTLNWEAEKIPSWLMWVSNAGRPQWPWLNRHYALGIEPVCAYFDAGVTASCAPNPISERGMATSLKLEPGRPFDLSYRMGVE